MNISKLLLVLFLTAAAFFALSAAAQKVYTQRRAQVDQMSDEQKRALGTHWEHFSELPKEKRDQLRQLHDDLESDPDSASLKRVMDQYHEWVETLPWTTRAELQELPTEERIARVRDLREEESIRTLSPEDRKVVFTWFLRQFGHPDARIPPEELDSLLKLDPRERWEKLAELGRRNPRMVDRPGEKEFEKALPELRRQLSPRVRAVMEKKSVQQQGRFVFQWILAASGPFPRGRPPFGGLGREIGESELLRVLEDLPQEEQRRLKGLSDEERSRELRRLYWQRRFGGPDGRMGPDRRGPGRNRSGAPGRRGRAEDDSGEGQRPRLGPPPGNGPRDGAPEGPPPRERQ